MKKVKLIYLFGVFLLILPFFVWSFRANEKDVEIKEFPKTLQLNSKIESDEGILVRAYSDMQLYDNYLLVLDNRSDSIIKFFDKSNLKYLFSRIAKGKELNEIQHIETMQVRDKRIFLFNNLDNQFIEIDILKLINDNNSTQESSINIDLPYSYDCNLTSSDKLIASGGTRDCILYVYDTSGNMLNKVGQNPDKSPKGFTRVEYFNSLNKFRIEPFPNKDQFVVSSWLSDKIQVFSDTGEGIYNLIGADNISARFDYSGGCPIPDSIKFGFYDIIISKKFIYGLYSGYCQMDHNQTSSVMIFTYKGKAIARLELGKNLKAFEVDEKNGIIYGIQLRPNKIFMYEFEL